MAEATLIGLANDLAVAVEITMNPTANQQQRMDAYNACEKFKEISPLCAQVGFYLVTNNFTTMVKHFGLQLMEHQVKFNWNKISQEEKIFIKDNTMRLLQTGVGPADDKSLLHIKDALSRIVVEMIKREWPQQWPSLLTELSQSSSKGCSQTELVAMIFLRLVEDVAILQTIESNQRRKDIYQALTVNMTEIFVFFMNLIEKNATDYVSTRNVESCRVVQVTLNTLSGFVEWVSISHLVASNGKLLQMICYLLTFPEFQLDAVEVLSQITNRKNVIKERKPLLIFFNDEFIRNISQSLEPMATKQNETYHQYLKKLSTAMQGLANQLTTMWGKEADIQCPPRNFVVFLHIIIELARHPSISVTHGAVQVWIQLVKHDAISRDPIFIDSIRAMIEIIAPKILKRPYPTRDCYSPNAIPYTTDAYICLDFDSEDDYLQFINRSRNDLLDIFRHATLVAPVYTFSYCEGWLQQRFEKSASENLTSCAITDPIYLEWEAIVAVLDGVLSRILLVTERPAIINGLRLLEKCLLVKTNDPLIYSVLLSCISSLFVFLSMSSANNNSTVSGVQLLPPVLDKIFSAIVFPFPAEDPNSLRSAAVKNLRRHAASSIVKISLKYPLLLLPIFDQINTTVKTLYSANEQQHLTNMEKLLLQEALLIISNHFCEFERQQLFVGEVIRPAVRSWQELSAILKSPVEFINFTGLSSKAPNIKSQTEDMHFKNRSTLTMAVNIVLGVIKRCNIPDDPDKSHRGGFIIGTTETGNPITRNPSAPHVIPLLQHILSLLRCLNELYNPSSVALIHEDYKTANNILECEKKQLIGVVFSQPDPLDPTQLLKHKTSLDYMQQFLSMLYDSCYHMMGSAGCSLGRDLYGLEGLSSALIASVFSNLEHVPDYRLRTINRVFLRTFVYSCPTIYHNSVLVPIFGHFSPFMLNRLTSRWDYITALYENGSLGDDTNNDTQEVLDDILNRNLTREYLDVLKVALVGGTAGTHDTTEIGLSSVMDHDDQSMDAMPNITRAAQAAMQSDIISELGKKLLTDPNTREVLVYTIFNCIQWNDSNASMKACLLAGPVIRQLASDQLVTANLATVVLTRVLQGLQLHGHHDANHASLIPLGVQVYEIIRPLHTNIVLNIMQQIPNLNINDLQKLDEKIVSVLTNATNTAGATLASGKSKIDKNKKDLFKKITSPLIGKNVLSRLFRNPGVINELHPLNNNSGKQKNTNILDSAFPDTGQQMQQLFFDTPR